MTIFNVFTLIGGLALFLFGMDVMGKALERQAGGRLQSILNTMTGTRFHGFLLGLAVTSVIQSSSATTVMVVGFVNSGIMQLRQAIAIIMGSNVGTTVTGWILSLSGLEGESFIIRLLKPSSFSPILAAVGIILYMFCKSEKKKGVGTILLGFSILMFGMETMSGAMEPLKDEEWFTSLFLRFSNPLLGVAAGAILTGIIQSSSASVGILQALAATGLVPMSSAIPIIMGQNIGTCVTALIASVGTSKNAKRAAIVHLYFNIIGVILFLSLFYGINAIHPLTIMSQQASAFNIAVVHSVFNILTTAVLLPFTGLLEKLAMLTIRDSAADHAPVLLDERLFTAPGVAAKQAWNVACQMAELSRSCINTASGLIGKWDDKSAEQVLEEETRIDSYEDALGTYLVKLSAYQLNEEDNECVNITLHAISDLERIGDHALNISQSAQELYLKGISFSDEAKRELEVLTHAVTDLVGRTIDSFTGQKLDSAEKVEPQEEVIDGLVREIKERHIERLRSGTCTIECGFILNDILTNFERVADHCSNIAVELMEVSAGAFNTHEHINSVKTSGGDFDRRFERYRERYTIPESSDGIQE